MVEEQVFFPAGALKLQGLLAQPDGAARGVVLCHPHPLYGGNMLNRVIASAAAALQAKGLATLRFNFRGVGLSEGRYAGGEGEVEDALAALTYLSTRLGEKAPLGICGYSFGGMVALRAAAAGAKVLALAAIAPVVEPPEVLNDWARPKLIVVATEDGLLDPQHLVRWTASLPEPKEIRLVEGADHFFAGYEQEVGEAIASFFTTCLPA